MAGTAGAVASGALSGAAAGSVVPGLGTAVGAGVGALAGYLGSRKTKGEKELEAANAAEAARIASEQARLGGGNGGMSASKLLAARGAVHGQAASAANEQIANAMRGSSAGAAGLQQQAVANINEGEQRALSQGESSLRAQDLDYAEQQRQALQAQKQQLFQNQIHTTDRQVARRQAVASSLGGAGQMAAGIPVSQVPVGGGGVGSAYTNQSAQFTPAWDWFDKKEQ